MFRDFTLGRYPIGIQSFESIRQGNRIYVDKTELIYRLTHSASYNFLSRPRRFGKSLLLSTIKAYYQGRKELFKGLAISHLESEWNVHPVFHLSMGHGLFDSFESTLRHLSDEIIKLKTEFGLQTSTESLASQFAELIRESHLKFGHKTVILIDEYDKPLLETTHLHSEVHDNVRQLMRSFYSVIKDCGDHLEFVMITGVTKFSHINIFSGLNNLRDITLMPDYNAICGIAESEMHSYFKEDIEVLAKKNSLSYDETAVKLKLFYDGYKFADRGENIYNPFSILCAFDAGSFDTYWFQTGTPQHLINTLSKRHYDFSQLEGKKYTAAALMGSDVSDSDPVALLYHSGYLTIKGFQQEGRRYILGFPNEEVSSGFYSDLLKIISRKNLNGPFDPALFAENVIDGKPEEFLVQIKSLLSGYSYMEIQDEPREFHFQTLIKAICLAVGLDVKAEAHTSQGRVDLTMQTKNFIYLIEFKVDSTPEVAIQQIILKNYADKYLSDSRRIFKIGANFSTKTRSLTGWIIE